MVTKKSTSTLAPPINMAATKATSTPDFPRPARCGFELCVPMAQTMAAMTSPATQAMSPIGEQCAHDVAQAADPR